MKYLLIVIVVSLVGCKGKEKHSVVILPKSLIDSLFPAKDAWKYDTITIPGEPPCNGNVGIPDKDFPDARPQQHWDSCLKKWEDEGNFYAKVKIKTLIDNDREVVYLIPKGVKFKP